jgi:CubicO group peptidase (beta-lactamase class C family)
MQVPCRAGLARGAQASTVAGGRLTRSLRRWVAVMLLSCAVGAGCTSSESSARTSREVRLQAAVDGFLESHLVPGASVAVIDRGELSEAVAGVADMDTGRAVTPSTRFRVASVTKMYFAAIVLRLVDDGDLALDAPIGDLTFDLPEPLAFAHALTLRELLSHTSGLTQTFTSDEDRHRSLTLADRLARIRPRCVHRATAGATPTATTCWWRARSKLPRDDGSPPYSRSSCSDPSS